MATRCVLPKSWLFLVFRPFSDASLGVDHRRVIGAQGFLPCVFFLGSPYAH